MTDREIDLLAQIDRARQILRNTARERDAARDQLGRALGGLTGLGWQQERIAQYTGLSQSSISRTIRRITPPEDEDIPS